MRHWHGQASSHHSGHRCEGVASKNAATKLVDKVCKRLGELDHNMAMASHHKSLRPPKGSLHSIIFHDAIQLALAGCKFSWAAQVLQCFSALDEPLPLVADAPIAIDINLLQELFLRNRLASFDSLPQDPRLAPSAGVKLCTYHRWVGRPQNAACPSYWESPMGNAKLHRILRLRMGSHHLPVEEGRPFNLPRASRVCNLCNTDALGDERHMLLECPALADLRLQFSSLLLPCSGVMRRLLWAKDQHEVCRYIIACLDRMSSH